jgi:hypothetical protein
MKQIMTLETTLKNVKELLRNEVSKAEELEE